MEQPSVQKTTAVKATETAREVRKMLKAWYEKAHEYKRTGERQVTWSMMGTNYNLLVAMDVMTLWTENYASLAASKKVEGPFIAKAESAGFSNLCCGYSRTVLGYCIAHEELGIPPDFSPDGGLALPDFLVTSTGTCDPRFKWYQAMGKYLKVPLFAYDRINSPPLSMKLTPDLKERYIQYGTAQFWGLVEFLEQQCGHKMDWDKFREVDRLDMETWRMAWQTYELRKAVPGPVPTQDMMSSFVPRVFMPSEPATLDFYTRLRDETKERVNKKQGVIPNEKFRVMWAGGLPPWHNMGIYNYFESLGAVAVFETTYNPGEPTELENEERYHPIELFQRRLYAGIEQDWAKAFGPGGSGYPQIETLKDYIRDYKIDGLVMHATKSCRATSIGQTMNRDLIRKFSPVPVLFLESDIIDARDYSEADTRARIDAFVETLDAIKSGRRRAEAAAS
ncbi:MAG: 2-hydroxyacyl-CoA dehydratase [Chloroflexi bacterium]|nr:2-hydroxyacyl-CoA dehydratase [Chloroflexota bacterium]